MPLQEEMEIQGNFLFRYRGSLPLIILLIALVVFACRVEKLPASPVYDYICFGISILGLIIRIYTVGHTPGHTSGRNTKQQIAAEVNATGMYSVVRHPLYVGNFFMWLGAAMLTYQFWFILFFVAAYWIYYERIMFAEEQFLRKKFGESYLRWSSTTPAFIPALRKLVTPAYPFSLKKIIRKETNGLMNVFIVFTIFDVVKHYMLTRDVGFENLFWPIGFAVLFIMYACIKILSKTTLLFDDERL
jgi:protein-S-isoprenylcysteine O-methyltransferase Ste14